MQVNTTITMLSGVGPKKTEALNRIGIETLRDLLEHYPRSYQDRSTFTPISQVKPDQVYQIRGKVIRPISSNSNWGKRKAFRLMVEDATGTLEVVFFNARYLTGFFK